MTKTCKICGFKGDADLFAKNRRICLGCYSKRQAHYRDNADKEKRSEYNRQYRQNNNEPLKTQKKKYYEENKDSILEQNKVRYQINSEDIKIKNSEYRKNNKNKRNARDKERRSSDPVYKLRTYISSDVLLGLKRNNGSKMGQSTFDHIGYSVKQLKDYLEQQFEPWMSWDNHGKYNSKTWDDIDPTTWTWQIDHIIPRADLPFSSMIDNNFKKCWALNNLRPLSSKANIVNGSKLKRRKK
jgi:hypothetical protein